VGAVVTATRRVVLERWEDADAKPLARIGTSEVVRYLGGTPWTVESAAESIDLWRNIDARLGVTTWAVRSAESRELIGTCGFAGTNAPWLRFDFVIEIGWTLARSWWGRGLATEAARAALDVGLAQHSRERIVSKCHVENIASERVMHRIGMHRVGIVQGSWPEPTIVCRFT
jgi:RimJ/RimL family protein N-acetyltransferase